MRKAGGRAGKDVRDGGLGESWARLESLQPCFWTSSYVSFPLKYKPTYLFRKVQFRHDFQKGALQRANFTQGERTGTPLGVQYKFFKFDAHSSEQTASANPKELFGDIH